MRRRLLAPVAVVGAIAIGTAVPHLASADQPNLPPLDAAQLLAKATSPQVTAFSGTVELTSNLGLPDISALTGGSGQGVSTAGFDPMALLSGTHTANVWEDGADQQRIALLGSLQEVDWVHDGEQLWEFDSSTSQVTRYVAAAAAPATEQHATPSTPALTPAQVAARILRDVQSVSTVSVVNGVYVGDRSAYQLQLTPDAADSTVSAVTIAIDSATGVPLRVQVMPRGSSAPALSVGFTAFDPTRPAASNFAAPTGTSTVTKALGGGNGEQPAPPGAPAAHPQPTTSGSSWGTVVHLPAGTVPAKAGAQVAALSTTVTLPSGGSAKLVSSALLNALVLPDGSLVAGFVTPTALEAAA